jgi:hypothetical protein
MTPLHAHLICVGLVAADLLARAWRIQWIVKGLGHRMSLWDSFVLNAFGDAAYRCARGDGASPRGWRGCCGAAA